MDGLVPLALLAGNQSHEATPDSEPASLSTIDTDHGCFDSLQDFEALIAGSRDALAKCWERFRMTLVVRDSHLVFPDCVS